MKINKMMLPAAISAVSLALSANAMAATWKLATGDAAGGTQYELKWTPFTGPPDRRAKL